MKKYFVLDEQGNRIELLQEAELAPLEVQVEAQGEAQDTRRPLGWIIASVSGWAAAIALALVDILGG